jgi:hypothetical protein
MSWLTGRFRFFLALVLISRLYIVLAHPYDQGTAEAALWMWDFVPGRRLPAGGMREKDSRGR